MCQIAAIWQVLGQRSRSNSGGVAAGQLVRRRRRQNPAPPPPIAPVSPNHPSKKELKSIKIDLEFESAEEAFAEEESKNSSFSNSDREKGDSCAGRTYRAPCGPAKSFHREEFSSSAVVRFSSVDFELGFDARSMKIKII